MKLSLTGKKSRFLVTSEDTDPLDPVETDEVYNRYQVEDLEGYPEIPLHIGDVKPHAVATGVDTFYGMDHQQPVQSERAGDDMVDAPSGIEAVKDGLALMQRDAAENIDTTTVRVNVNASGDWSATTYFVDSQRAYQVVYARQNHGRTVITNWSPADVYVSHHQPPDVTTGATPDVVKVAANGGTRTIITEKEIWARGTTALAQQIDVHQEYN